MKVRIKTVAKALPEYCCTTAETLPFVRDWLKGKEDRFVRKVIKIFENAGVQKRYAIMPPEKVFSDMGFAERNRLYAKAAIALGEQCLSDALAKAGWKADQLDYIITVSCTGIMIPSLDAYLINRLGLRQDIIRLPVTEMGCAAGVSGLIYAKNFLKENPGKRAALVSVESPSATFQYQDFSMANIVSAAIFGDGAACVLLSSDPGEDGPQILDQGMYHFYDAEQLMGFELTDTGLQMVLDVAVPERIADHFGQVIHPFLEANGIAIKDIDHLVFHPGGKKIIQVVESLFGELGKDLELTKTVLGEYGNMSSATVLYVLEKFIERSPKEGDRGLMLSFGPGFSAQRILLQW